MGGLVEFLGQSADLAAQSGHLASGQVTALGGQSQCPFQLVQFPGAHRREPFTHLLDHAEAASNGGEEAVQMPKGLICAGVEAQPIGCCTQGDGVGLGQAVHALGLCQFT